MRQPRFRWLMALALAAAMALTRSAAAQEEPTKSDDKKPMSLDKPMSESTEKSDSGGFWMFPSPAPFTGPIVTDRPGFSDSAGLVPRGRIQLETGYTFTYDRDGPKRVIDHTWPELGFRTGLTDWLEFRMGWAGGSWTETLDRIKTLAGRHVGHEDHDDSGTDMTIGVKMPVMKQDGWKPNASVILSLGLPTGGASKSANNVVPTIKMPWNYAINQQLTIYGSLLGRVPDGPEGQFFQTGVTLAGGYKVHDRVTLYMEYFGLYNASRRQDASHILSAGPIIRVTDNVSLDMRAGLGLNEEAPDFQASIGMGIRF